MDLSNVFVQLRIPSRDFGKVTGGTKVDIQLISIPDRTFHGTITPVSGEADPLTGNVNMFALVENKVGTRVRALRLAASELLSSYLA